MSNEYGRKPYLGKGQSYTAMQRAQTDKTMRELNVERYAKHSEFKKPYLSDRYRDMEHFGYDGTPWDEGPGLEVTVGDSPGQAPVCLVTCDQPSCFQAEPGFMEYDCLISIRPESCPPIIIHDRPEVILREPANVFPLYKYKVPIGTKGKSVHYACAGIELSSSCFAEVDLEDSFACEDIIEESDCNNWVLIVDNWGICAASPCGLAISTTKCVIDGLLYETLGQCKATGQPSGFNWCRVSSTSCEIYGGCEDMCFSYRVYECQD